MKLPTELSAYLSGLEEVLAQMPNKERNAYIEAIRSNKPVQKKRKSRSTKAERPAGKLKVRVTRRRRARAKAADR